MTYLTLKRNKLKSVLFSDTTDRELVHSDVDADSAGACPCSEVKEVL